MTQTTIESQVLAQLEQKLSPDYEIDSADDADFGKLYRLWKNLNLAGTFYQSLDGKWVAQPIRGQVNGKFDTEKEVILAIIAATSNNVFRSQPDIDSLLDKQFDSLTAAEWQYLMTVTPSESEVYCHLEAAVA
jgi:hypothetical protein